MLWRAGRPVLTVGLTGGIGSGKSAVSALLATQGAAVVDADLVARDVVAPGTPGMAAVIAAFGPQLLLSDGSLDRSALGGLVFADDGARKRLNGIVHPLIAERTRLLFAAAERDRADVVVHDVPLPADLSPGDLVAVPASGAYHRSMANNYNHVPRPPVVAVKDGTARLLVRRETEDDLIALDVE